MARARDDMVIRPLLRRGRRRSVRDKVRERAREERKTSRVKQHRSRIMRRVRKAALARRALRSRTAAARLRAKGGKVGGFKAAAKGAKTAARGALRAAGLVVTVVSVLAELIVAGGRAARRASGHSKRLVEATDAHTLYGGMDEAIQANLATVQFVEGNEDLLRIIGRQGRVNEQIADLMNEKRRLFLMRAQGADMINRDPDLDAPETLVDMLIAKANKAGLKGLADRAGSAVRSRTLKGPIKTGR